MHGSEEPFDASRDAVKEEQSSEYCFRILNLLIVTVGHLLAFNSQFHSTSDTGLGTSLDTA